MALCSSGSVIRAQLPFPLISSAFANAKAKPWSVLPVLVVSFLLFLSNGVEAGASTSVTITNIGAIIDVNSRIGKEEKTAMEIAVRNFNSKSGSHKLSLYFQEPGGDPLQAASAAEKLIKERKVEVIIGTNTWEEAALVAGVGSRAQVPMLSFASPAITPPLASIRWPFLVRFASNGAEEMRCIAALVHSYTWRRVVVIYEDDVNGGESGNLPLLSESLQQVGSEIEYRLVLPPSSLLSDPRKVVHGELVKLQNLTQSRVFIILQSSLPMLTHLFKEAKDTGLVGRDTAWIISSSITSSLDFFDSSVVSSMEGTLGIKAYYSASSSAYKTFEAQFKKIFRAEYLEEDVFEPGVHALRAYDGMRTVSQAIQRMQGNNSTPKLLLKSLLETKFTGLSGKIGFNEGELSQAPIYRIVNLVGKKYKEIDFWLPHLGFSKTLIEGEGRETYIAGNVGEHTGRQLSSPIFWPGDLSERSPKGWAMPTAAKPMKIVVPKKTSFEKFVTCKAGKEKPEGFCIDLFDDVIQRLNYPLPHKFSCHDGDYDDVILGGVHNNTFDAAVGDITILAERTKYVEFTQPYAESGLSMVVPSKPDSARIMIKPFNFGLWIASGGIFVYTMVIVWLLEHHSNEEFQGPWKDQIGTALWFTFSSLFFAHSGEKINSNLTRVVVVVWLIVVFILTSSYTASLTSMLTVKRMESDFSSYKTLQKNKLNVGCDNDSFIKGYLTNVLNFEPDKIKIFDNESDYTSEFESNHISAAFLEIPYEKLFMNQHCKSYTTSRAIYRFGGFGFAFQKGSPIAADFSKAILELSEDGTLKELEERWFKTSSECSSSSDSGTDSRIESLSLHSFWGLFITCIAISTICLVIFLIRLIKKFRRDEHQANGGNEAAVTNSVRSTVVRFASYFHNGGKVNGPGRVPSPIRPPDSHRWSSSSWEYVSPSEATRQASSPAETGIEML